MHSYATYIWILLYVFPGTVLNWSLSEIFNHKTRARVCAVMGFLTQTYVSLNALFQW